MSSSKLRTTCDMPSPASTRCPLARCSRSLHRGGHTGVTRSPAPPCPSSALCPQVPRHAQSPGSGDAAELIALIKAAVGHEGLGGSFPSREPFPKDTGAQLRLGSPSSSRMGSPYPSPAWGALPQFPHVVASR